MSWLLATMVFFMGKSHTAQSATWCLAPWPRNPLKWKLLENAQVKSSPRASDLSAPSMSRMVLLLPFRRRLHLRFKNWLGSLRAWKASSAGGRKSLTMSSQPDPGELPINTQL